MKTSKIPLILCLIFLTIGCGEVANTAKLPAMFDFSQRGAYPTIEGQNKTFRGTIEFESIAPAAPSGGSRSETPQDKFEPGHPWYALSVDSKRYRLYGAEYPELYPYVGKTATVLGKIVQYATSAGIQEAIAPARINIP